MRLGTRSAAARLESGWSRVESRIEPPDRALGRRFCWMRDSDAAGLTRVASDRRHRWGSICDFASRTSHRAVVC